MQKHAAPDAVSAGRAPSPARSTWLRDMHHVITSHPVTLIAFVLLGIILFAVGALLVTFQFFATLSIAKKERTYEETNWVLRGHNGLW